MSLFVAALIFVVNTSGWAQQADTTVVPVGEIIVQAARPVTTAGGASAIELRLDSLRTQAAPTLDQILRQIPFVQVRVNSRGESQFSLRGSGSDARQVAVIVDGIPLNFAWDDRADLSVLPSTAAQTLTIARGLPSLLHGPNVLGGVVEIGVARGPPGSRGRAIRFDASADHTGATGIATALMLPIQNRTARWQLRAGGGHRQRAGFVLPDRDDELRANTDLQHFDGFAALSYRPANGFWADASISGFTAKRGIAPELHITSPRFWRYPKVKRTFAVVAAGTGEKGSPLGGRGDLELSLGVDAGRTEIDQFADQTYTTVESEEDSNDRNFTVRIRADQTLGRTGELKGGFTYADINHDEMLRPGGTADYRQALWSGALELHWNSPRLVKGTRFAVGGAVDGARTPESGDKPRLEALTAYGARAGFTTALNTQLVIHAGASVRSRFPSLRELYSGALGRFEPNPALHPEQLTAVEAGLSAQHGAGQTQLIGFHHVLEDAIVRVAVTGGRFQRVNRDRQSGSGVELLSAWRIGSFSVSGDVVFQDTELTDPASGAVTEPEYQPAIIAGLGLSGPLPLSARFDVRARHTGRQTCINPDNGSLIELGSARRLDAEISRAWRRRGPWISDWELAIAADNLNNEVIYDQCGLPQPGRTLRIQLRLR